MCTSDLKREVEQTWAFTMRVGRELNTDEGKIRAKMSEKVRRIHIIICPPAITYNAQKSVHIFIHSLNENLPFGLLVFPL